MSRLSVMRSLARGCFHAGHQSLGQALAFRYLSDNSDSPSDQVQSKLGPVEMQKPSVQTSFRFAWPDAYSSEFNEVTDDGFPPTWDFKNNELDVEQLAGLPSPNKADDPYFSYDYEEEISDEEERLKFQEELQFGRMLALREQLNRELFSSEPFTLAEVSSLDSVRENVDFMMKELKQISFMLKTLCLQQDDAISCPNSMIEDNCVMGKAYTESEPDSWDLSLDKQDAGVKEKESMEFQVPQEDSESLVKIEKVPTAEEKSSEQDTEVTAAADDSPKTTPAKPSDSTPRTDGRQDPAPQETIHTYKPFRTIDVPAPEPSQSLCPRTNADVQAETAAVERVENFTVATKLSESESRLLMQMALKQALSNLEAGRTNYSATLVMAKDEESHGLD